MRIVIYCGVLVLEIATLHCVSLAMTHSIIFVCHHESRFRGTWWSLWIKDRCIIKGAL